MLWYKAWLETRFGLAFLFGLYTLVWLVASTGARLAPANQAPKPQELAFLADAFAFPFIAAAISLAGTGIKTPSGGFQNQVKGLHGSTLYTLSLPVSRLKLVGIRATVGLLETAVVIVVFTLVGWWLFPKQCKTHWGRYWPISVSRSFAHRRFISCRSFWRHSWMTGCVSPEL
jgi:hypothetical protein